MWYINSQKKMFLAIHCDKCGELVPATNSSIALEEEAGNFGGFCQDRHLFATADCPGSPSRVRLVQSDPKWQQAYEVIRSYTGATQDNCIQH